MNKATAKKILSMMETEMSSIGKASNQTIREMKDAVEKVGKDYLDYLYPENGKILFNTRRWKRHFLEDKAM